MSSARIVSPVYSMTWPLPPAVVILPMIASTMSLAEQPKPSVPETSICMFFAGFCSSVWVAITCSTSDVPMPNASAPSAPCVEVWLSPQTIVVPGRRQAQFRPDDVHDALPHIQDRDVGHAELDDVLLQRLHLDAAVLFLDVGRNARADGRDIVVGDGDGQVRTAQLAAGQAQPLERLRAGDLVQQVAVDIEDAGAVGESLDDVAVPDLVEKGAWPAGGHIRSGLAGFDGVVRPASPLGRQPMVVWPNRHRCATRSSGGGLRRRAASA